MTELLYQTDSTLRTFRAQVEQVNSEDRAICLDRSAFYPGGGGQPHDLGSLTADDGTAWSVVKVKKNGDDVWHFLGADSALPAIGQMLTGELDWARRYALMRTHTAMHILCGVVFRDYGAQVTGGEMDVCKGRMDFEFETLSKELVGVIEESVNREVVAAHSVNVQILPREAAFQIPDLIRTKINLLPPGIQFVRIVELDGLDLQADGGTHVQNTQEVGRMRIVEYKSKGKINKRIYVELD